MAEIERGMPDTDRVLALLNDAFDGWGDEDFLRWKYAQYPGFDPDEHVFYIERNGELAAFRRVFEKELLVEDSRISGFVLGDTSVAKAHRGQGLYSQLHSTTVEHCREIGAELVYTFNRTNNVTFAANRKRGWRYHTLPLQMRILSAKPVLSEYVDLVLGDWQRVKRAVDLVGNRVALVVGGERVPVSAFGTARSGEGSAKRSLAVPLPASIVRRLVRAFGRQSTEDTMKTLVGLSGDDQFDSTNPAASDLEAIDVTETATPDDYERVRSLYDDVRPSNPAFRREIEDIRHLCQFPAGSRAVFAERSGELCGFAVLGTVQNGAVTECRVLDIVATDAAPFRRLVDAIERSAADRDHDLVVLLSERDAGRRWTPIRKQVVMWDRVDNRPEAERLDRDWHVGLYDAV